jgi:hypothetical protein
MSIPVLDSADTDDELNIAINNLSIENKISIVDKICDFIAINTDKNIVLLRNREVIMWIFGDLSFLPKFDITNKTTDAVKYKQLEDSWGQQVLKTRRPDLKLDKRCTINPNLFWKPYFIIGINKPFS